MWQEAGGFVGQQCECEIGEQSESTGKGEHRHNMGCREHGDKGMQEEGACG